MDVLVRIKRLVLKRAVRFTQKALEEMDYDDLTEDDVCEAVMNAQSIFKSLRSTSPNRTRSDEKLHVIKSFTYSGVLIYTKGKIARFEGEETFYVFISSKIATFGD